MINRRLGILLTLLITITGIGLYLGKVDALQSLSPLFETIMISALGMLIVSLLFLSSTNKVPGKVEYTNFSWFSMLFSTGMGIGILNYGFQEGIMLTEVSNGNNPVGQVLNHWTLIPWGMYTFFALIEILDSKYKILPNWMQTLRRYCYSISMILGVGVSFALGIKAVDGVMNQLYQIDIPYYVYALVFSALVMISVYSGMQKGLRKFSNITMWGFYLFTAVTVYIASKYNLLEVMSTGLKSFTKEFFSNNLYDGSELQKNWTVYYVIWFMAWCPFVSPFIAEVSKGRSLRSVVLAVLIVPSILIFIFMMSGTAIGTYLSNQGVETSVLQFKAISDYVWMPILYVLLMIGFYITSSDSQAVTLDKVMFDGSEFPIWRKILWVAIELIVVLILLYAGDNTVDVFMNLSLLSVPVLILYGLVSLIFISLKGWKSLQKRSS